MARLERIEGIGSQYGRKLATVGLRTTEKMLQAGATRKGREELAQATGISHKLILTWVNKADLFRVKGVGEEYSDLLEFSGVDSVAELAQRNPENLRDKMAEVNAKKKLVRQLPSAKAVMQWVAHAKKLPRAVHH